MSEIKLENVQSAIVGSTVTTEGGDVLVNAQKVTNIFYSAQYQDLIKQRDKLQDRFDRSQQRIKKYPNDKDFKDESRQFDNLIHIYHNGVRVFGKRVSKDKPIIHESSDLIRATIISLKEKRK